jgi:hypothetical protein
MKKRERDTPSLLLPSFINIQKLVAVFGSTIGITAFWAIGAVISSRQLEIGWFSILSIPVVISYWPLNYHAMTLFIAHHGMSTIYLKIRVRRIE